MKFKICININFTTHATFLSKNASYLCEQTKNQNYAGIN